MKWLVLILLPVVCWGATELDFYKAQTSYLSSLLIGERIIEQAQQRSAQITGEAQKKMQAVCKELGGELKPNSKGEGMDCSVLEGKAEKKEGEEGAKVPSSKP